MNLLDRYSALAERERRLVLWGGIGGAVLVLVFAILWPLHSAVTSATRRVDQQAADLAWMRLHELDVRAAATATAGAGESLVVIIDQTARSGGVGESIRATTPTSANGTRVELENVPFDLLAGWLASLQERYGVTVLAATVDRSAGPGLVNASLELTRAGA